MTLDGPVRLAIDPAVDRHLSGARAQLAKLQEQGIDGLTLDRFLTRYPSLLAASNPLRGGGKACTGDLVAAPDLLEQALTHIVILDGKARQSIEAFTDDLRGAMKNLAETWEASDQIKEGTTWLAEKGREALAKKGGKLRAMLPQLEAAEANLAAACRKLRLDLVKDFLKWAWKWVEASFEWFDNRLADAEFFRADVEAIQQSEVKGYADMLFKTDDWIGEQGSDLLQEKVVGPFAGLASGSHEKLVGYLLERAGTLAMEGRLFWTDPKRPMGLVHDQAVAAAARHDRIFAQDYRQETTAAWLELSRIIPGTVEAYIRLAGPKRADTWKEIEEGMEEAGNIKELLESFAVATRHTDRLYGTAGAALGAIKGLKFLTDIRDMQATMVDIFQTICRSTGKK